MSRPAWLKSLAVISKERDDALDEIARLRQRVADLEMELDCYEYSTNTDVKACVEVMLAEKRAEATE